MTNRICEVHLYDQLNDPAEAEVWVGVVPGAVAATTEVRGRLVGPRCHYATTVEVAYPLRPFPRSPAGIPGLPMRVVVPEASLWEPESPFLYQGRIELWEEGQLCDQVQRRHGLRTLQLTPQGLRLNGRPLTIHGAVWQEGSEETARGLRQQGHNTLLADIPAASAWWPAADQFGFLMLGRLDGSAESLQQAGTLSAHACCLGWLLDAEVFGPGRLASAVVALQQNRSGCLVGAELQRSPAEPLPPGIHFILCAAPLLAELAEIDLPKVVRMDRLMEKARNQELLVRPGILGSIAGV